MDDQKPSNNNQTGIKSQQNQDGNNNLSVTQDRNRVDALIKHAEGILQRLKCSELKPGGGRFPPRLSRREIPFPLIEGHSDVEQLPDQQLSLIRQKEDQESPFGRLLSPERPITVDGKDMTGNDWYNFCTAQGLKCTLKGIDKLQMILPSERRTRLMEIKAQRSGLRGKIVTVNGDEYTGEWKDDMRHGKGTQVWKMSGVIYDGEWKFDKCDGYGTYIACYSPKKGVKWTYCGNVMKGKKHGYGECCFETATFYEGQWSQGQRSGFGRVRNLNGDEYVGEWLNDKMHGDGTMRYANGSVHEGFWEDGKKHGKGMFYDANRGRLYVGLWVDGAAKCGILSDHDKDGNPIPKEHPMPPICLKNVEKVLWEGESQYLSH